MNGHGPSHGYLAQLAAALRMHGQAREEGGDVQGVQTAEPPPNPFLPPPSAPGAPQMLPPMTPDAGGGYPSLAELAAQPPPPPPPAGAPPPPAEPAGGEAPGQMPPLPMHLVSGEVAPGDAGVQGGAAPDGRALYPNDVIVRSAGPAQTIPAHEAMTKGPKQLGHLMAAFDAPEEAARSQDLRNQMQAYKEDAMYAEQAKAAQEREIEARAQLARRQQQMQTVQGEYLSQLDNLSQQHLDQGRLFANMSTGENIVTTILLGLGALGGGVNKAAEAVQTRIERDIDAQKFDYQAGLDRAKGLHTAYGMLMDRYHEEDIALAGARVAALDYALARANGMKAQWKGTDSANDLDAIIGKLGQDRENTLANAMALVGATTTGGGYTVDVRDRGGMQRLAGTLTAEQARKVQLEHGVKPNTATELAETHGGIALTAEAQRAQHALERMSAKATGKETPLERNTRIFNAHSNYLDKAASQLVGDIPGSTTAKIPGSGSTPWASDARAYQVKIDEYNAMADTILSHALKDANGGRPPAGELKRNFERVELTATMPDATKLDRIKLLRHYSDEAAKADGVVGAGEVKPASGQGAAPANAPTFKLDRAP